MYSPLHSPSHNRVEKEFKSWPYSAYILIETNNQQIFNVIVDNVKGDEGKQNGGRYQVTKCWGQGGDNTAISNVRVGRKSFFEAFKSIVD